MHAGHSLNLMPHARVATIRNRLNMTGAGTQPCLHDIHQDIKVVQKMTTDCCSDCHTPMGLLQRGLRSGLCSPDTPNLTELAESVDDTLFQCIMHNPYHVLYHLLPERRELVYNIRPRHHDTQLSIITGQLRKRNFIYRMLFKDTY